MVLATLILPRNAYGAVTLEAFLNLSYQGGPSELVGDIVATDTGAAAVYSGPEAGSLELHFYRFSREALVLAERRHSIAPLSIYEPALCWDGQDVGVVASIFTQAIFMRLSETGEIVAGPRQLQGLPSGAEAGRTAAFRVLWTGQYYAVFGLWLERQYPWQELTAGNFYTHLHYWLLGVDGEELTHRHLVQLAPMTYPGIEEAEKVYFDVVWTGQRFFVAYYSESQTGPPLSVYYRLFDIEGNLVRDESPLFAQQVGQGPRLAWNGRVVAVTALKTISMPQPDAGNYTYLRCFNADGSPRGSETEYGQKLGFGPVVFWSGTGFTTAYCVMYDWNNLGYALFMTPFDEDGQRRGAEYPMRNAAGQVVLGRIALAFDLQFTGGDHWIYGKAQNSDAWNISCNPVVFVLNAGIQLPPAIGIVRALDRVRVEWAYPTFPVLTDQ